MIVEMPTLVTNFLLVILLLTKNSNPCVPSGKMVVVIPEPSGQVKAIPVRFTLFPASKVMSESTVTVEMPVLLSYMKSVTLNRSAITGPLISRLFTVENPI